MLAFDEVETLAGARAWNEREELVIVFVSDGVVEHLRLSMGTRKEDALAGVAEEAEVDALWGDIHLGVGHGVDGENGEEHGAETACKRVGETSGDTRISTVQGGNIETSMYP